MSNHNEIASRIAQVIISPDAALGLLHGIISVPVDLGYMVYGYFDTESRHTHQTERFRIAMAIKHGILEYEKILEAIEIVFKYFNSYVPKKIQNKVYARGVFSVSGRIAFNSIVSSQIANAIIGSARFYTAARGTMIGNFLLAGGMMERCIRKSEELQWLEPEVYNLLRTKNYDLLYFLFEPAISSFIDALAVRRRQGTTAFENIIEMVDEKLSRYYGEKF